MYSQKTTRILIYFRGYCGSSIHIASLLIHEANNGTTMRKQHFVETNQCLKYAFSPRKTHTRRFDFTYFNLNCGFTFHIRTKIRPQTNRPVASRRPTSRLGKGSHSKRSFAIRATQLRNEVSVLILSRPNYILNDFGPRTRLM